VRFEPTDGGCAGPAGRFGIAATANNALSVFLGPFMGSLADAYGRKYIVALG
jgi:MFS family permease